MYAMYVCTVYISGHANLSKGQRETGLDFRQIFNFRSVHLVVSNCFRLETFQISLVFHFALSTRCEQRYICKLGCLGKITATLLAGHFILD